MEQTALQFKDGKLPSYEKFKELDRIGKAAVVALVFGGGLVEEEDLMFASLIMVQKYDFLSDEQYHDISIKLLESLNYYIIDGEFVATTQNKIV